MSAPELLEAAKTLVKFAYLYRISDEKERRERMFGSTLEQNLQDAIYAMSEQIDKAEGKQQAKENTE